MTAEETYLAFEIEIQRKITYSKLKTHKGKIFNLVFTRRYIKEIN